MWRTGAISRNERRRYGRRVHSAESIGAWVSEFFLSEAKVPLLVSYRSRICWS